MKRFFVIFRQYDKLQSCQECLSLRYFVVIVFKSISLHLGYICLIRHSDRRMGGTDLQCYQNGNFFVCYFITVCQMAPQNLDYIYHSIQGSHVLTPPRASRITILRRPSRDKTYNIVILSVQSKYILCMILKN